MSDSEKYRPPVEDRWVDGNRTEPGQIKVRTRFLYSERRPPDILVPEGRTTHPFSRGGRVTDSDWPSRYDHEQAVADHVHRAVASFGDDADVVIEVRLA